MFKLCHIVCPKDVCVSVLKCLNYVLSKGVRISPQMYELCVSQMCVYQSCVYRSSNVWNIFVPEVCVSPQMFELYVSENCVN